jgi:hypothetical protein
MLICTIFCLNTMLFSAQEDLVVAPLTEAENRVYQGLVAQFNDKSLGASDNTEANVSILKKQEAFLTQQIKMHATKQRAWPYGIAIALGALFTLTVPFIHIFSVNYGFSEGMRKIFAPIMWPTSVIPSLNPQNIKERENVFLHTLFYQTIQLAAFAGLYKQHAILKNPQIELETVRDITYTLKNLK